MYFLIKLFSDSLYTLIEILSTIFEKLNIILFIRPLEKFIMRWNPRSFLHYFDYYWFSEDYIFHWNKLLPSKYYAKRPEKTTYKENILGYKNEHITFRKNKTYFFYINKFFLNLYNAFSFYLNKTFGFGFYYIRGFFFILFIDACLTDDEPLWEPIEWSLVQTWILFIFAFAWIAENLIVSRYGSYTGRDKRVWMSWYKTFWLIEGYYMVNYGIVSIFVIVPFYFETNYNLSFVYSWWHWYSRVFFYKFIALYTIILFMAFLLQISLRWVNWKKSLVVIIFINMFIAYLLYTHFFLVFFGYFTDPIWYQKVRPVDYIQLSHEPARWGWGPAKKDHFTYHNVKTVFWFKNDGPFASSFLMFHLFFFICVFLLFSFWLSLLRRVLSTSEIPTTLTTYCVSSLRQFFYFFLFLYLLVGVSFLINYMRLPWEFFYFTNKTSWFFNLFDICLNYPTFIINIF